MSTLPPRIYKGFELHPLVFARKFDQFDRHSRYDEGFEVAVRVSRQEAAGAAGASRVFRLKLAAAISDFGAARRAAWQQGEDIIDGKIDGADVSDL
ncbi:MULTISPECIES: hypothetical protein [Caballeronia]|uniref:hypothetical protein n=1 Tax=Caballeronia TaxID=1827195 RepID=UPI000238866B|nr:MULTISPECIES: hypothetical protein [unclassified Caballeronia]AET94978.1 hypothetical protein BYI23_D014680 [Burkholderia sp. YI23]BAO92751.1 uncharacterized protein BRPE67_ECDS02540 [Burkholderia sp. RPE67]BBQ03366.1 hypothetical protein BSFA1_84940 [Burkholderia sp. SFA1]MCE4547358.1 hypothetical protein [Caballeronia sp. PC1]MCE4575342.1 hypothetical protein [Caballeronia sp. CLC5]